MPDTNAVVAVYDTHSAAEDAIGELKKSAFDMTKVSIVGKDYHTEENVVGIRCGSRDDPLRLHPSGDGRRGGVTAENRRICSPVLLHIGVGKDP